MPSILECRVLAELVRELGLALSGHDGLGKETTMLRLRSATSRALLLTATFLVDRFRSVSLTAVERSWRMMEWLASTFGSSLAVVRRRLEVEFRRFSLLASRLL